MAMAVRPAGEAESAVVFPEGSDLDLWPEVEAIHEVLTVFPEGSDLDLRPEVKDIHGVLTEELVVPRSAMTIGPGREAYVLFVPPLKGGLVRLD